jgi:hypothetical protein
MTHHTRKMADEAAAPEEAAAGPAEGGAAGSPAKHKRSALAPRIKRLMQARAPCTSRCAVASLTRAEHCAQRDDEVGKISQYTPLALGAHARMRANGFCEFAQPTC